MGSTKGLRDDGAGMDVRVSPPKARDCRFERSMGEALRQQNEKLEMQETEVNNLDRNAVATGVASFLEDALNSKAANSHLRRANMLVMGKQVYPTSIPAAFVPLTICCSPSFRSRRPKNQQLLMCMHVH